MAVFADIHHLPRFINAVITVGTFDGVHKGHKAILQEVVRHAEKAGGESVLLTFEPHPRKLLFPHQHLGLITSLNEKIQLISNAGINHIVVVPFNQEFAAMKATEYIENFIVGIFKPHSIVIGYDHRFGNDRAGNFRLLEQYSSQFGYQLVEIPAMLIDEAAVSSTKIRRAIEEGKMEDATHMLGRYFSIAGMVVKGNQVGRTIGFPTANIQPTDPEQIIPAHGVYAVYAVHHGNTYKGMLNIGLNPTVTDKKELRIEVNIFDFNQDIYTEELKIRFVKKVRDELKFASLEGLKDQIQRDKVAVEELLSV